MCLKLVKSTGLDRCPKELMKTMPDAGFQIAKIGVDEILTEDTSRQRATMNGTILKLHKGGSTNKTSDKRQIDINERLKQIVDPANILEAGQGGAGKDDASALTCPKCNLPNRRLGDRSRGVYQVDIDF